MRVFVALPCYNVGSRLGGVLDQIDRGLVDAVVVVDDGSRDDTAEVAGRRGGVTVIRHPRNLGYGETQKTIFRHFLEQSGDPQDVLVFLHGDGEMLPSEIPDLLKPLKDPRVEAALGSRMIPGSAKGIEARPAWKRGVDRLLSGLLNLAHGTRLSTYFGGYRALKGTLVERLRVEDLSPDAFFDMQVLHLIAKTAGRYVEVPITNVESDRPPGYSRVRVGLKILKMVLRSLSDRHVPKA